MEGFYPYGRDEYAIQRQHRTHNDEQLAEAERRLVGVELSLVDDPKPRTHKVGGIEVTEHLPPQR